MSHRPAQAACRTRACPAAYGPVVKETSASKPSLSDIDLPAGSDTLYAATLWPQRLDDVASRRLLN
jgi:hypothetical protein